ncbi:hypothetical protein LJC63_02590 [Ruminococcaceae bacterium OttesenSCG-928-L11]|nr:hypothetical protein [Ruminococcaceae bacterium OttesenSCG-928-L11]
MSKPVKCNPNNLILSVTAAALVLAEGRTVDEIALLAAAFSQLSETLTTIAAVKAASGTDDNSSDTGALRLLESG